MKIANNGITILEKSDNDILTVLSYFKNELRYSTRFECIDCGNHKFYYIFIYNKKLMVTEDEYNNFKRWLGC